MKKESSMSIQPPNNMKKLKNHQYPQLPTEIISEILSRLPIKTLFHCLLVCKHWLSLISSNPHFAYLHLSRSPITLLIKSIKRIQLRLIDLQMIDLHKQKKGYPQETQLKLIPKINFPLLGVQIINSCNGFLCLWDRASDIYVCNPILGEYILLPYSPYREIYHKKVIAFGFSFKTKQYKVIQFYILNVVEPVDQHPFDDVSYTSREEVNAEIYTIGEGSWRDLGRVPYYLSNRSFNSFLNGALHWLNFTPGGDPDFIRCLDFESEKFRVVPEPLEFGLHKEEEVSNRIQVGILQESLSLCDFSSHLHIDIWIMKDYGIKESWRKMFVVENFYMGNKWGNLDCFEPIMILKSGEILMLYNKDALILYNPKLGTFKKQNIHGIKSKFQATAHIPSFVSLQDFAKGESIVFLEDTGQRKLHVEALLCNALDRISDAVSLWKHSVQTGPPQTDGVPGTKDCMNHLRTIQSASSEFFVWAIRLFKNPNNRCTFMAFPNDELRIKWVTLEVRMEKARWEKEVAGPWSSTPPNT